MNTRITGMFGVQLPIIQAPMAESSDLFGVQQTAVGLEADFT